MVEPEYLEVKNRRGSIDDSYYLCRMPQLSTGKHLIEAILQNLNTKQQRKIQRSFTYQNGIIVDQPR